MDGKDYELMKRKIIFQHEVRCNGIENRANKVARNLINIGLVTFLIGFGSALYKKHNTPVPELEVVSVQHEDRRERVDFQSEFVKFNSSRNFSFDWKHGIADPKIELPNLADQGEKMDYARNLEENIRLKSEYYRFVYHPMNLGFRFCMISMALGYGVVGIGKLLRKKHEGERLDRLIDLELDYATSLHYKEKDK